MVMKMWGKIVLVLSLALLTACSVFPSSDSQNIPEEKLISAKEISNDQLIEDERIYDYSNEEDVVHLYVTILGEKETGKKVPSFYEMNQSVEQPEGNETEIVLDIVFQEGDENGPKGKISTENPTSNATIQQRGNSSRREVQKSYKIKLEESAGLWKGQDILNLNKHFSDPTRVRNKLSFDYFRI